MQCRRNISILDGRKWYKQQVTERTRKGEKKKIHANNKEEVETSLNK